MVNQNTEMVNLCKIVAVEKGVKTRTETELTRVYHLAQKGELFAGLARSYTPKDDDGDALPPENQIIAAKADDLVAGFAEAQIVFSNVIATKDWGNCNAVADIVVDGQTIVENVPVTYLLFLEKKLTEVKAFISKLPVLPATENWTWDDQLLCWRSEPAGTTKTRKIPDVQVLYEATDKHPAQVQPFTRDEVVGTWTTVKFSSAYPASKIAELSARATKMLEAVKFAREQANMTETPQVKIAEDIFGYIFS